MEVYTISVVNGGGVEIYSEVVVAKDENTALKMLLEADKIILSTDDTIRIY